MIIFSFAWRWSSLTHDLALSSDDCESMSSWPARMGYVNAYRLRDVVDNDGTIRIPIIHGRQRFVPLLPRSIPYLKFHRGVLVERDGLGQKRGADGRLSVIIELVL